MDKINTFGLAAYWYELEGEGTKKMQSELNLNYQFIQTLNLDKEYIYQSHKGNSIYN